MKGKTMTRLIVIPVLGAALAVSACGDNGWTKEQEAWFDRGASDWTYLRGERLDCAKDWIKDEMTYEGVAAEQYMDLVWEAAEEECGRRP